MDASRFWTMARLKNQPAELFGNFFPAWDREELLSRFDAEASHAPRKTVANTLAQWLPDRFATLVCSHLGCDPRLAMGQCPRRTRQGLLDLLAKFRFPVERDRGWNHAEVTAGGVPLEEVDFRTMESRIVPGLYLVGEILDSDGRIGGFNFQWAWATGTSPVGPLRNRGQVDPPNLGNCPKQHIQ